MGYVKCDDIFFGFEIEHGCLSWFPSYCCLLTSLYCLDHFSVFVFCLSLVCTTKKHFESAHLVQDGWLSLTMQHLNTLLDTGVIKLVGGEVMFEGFLPKKSPLFGLVIYHDPCIMRTNKNLRTVRVYLPGHWWDDPGRKGKLVNGGMMFFFWRPVIFLFSRYWFFFEKGFLEVWAIYITGMDWGERVDTPHSSLVTLKTVRMEHIRFWYQWPKRFKTLAGYTCPSIVLGMVIFQFWKVYLCNRDKDSKFLFHCAIGDAQPQWFYCV